jgi:cytochrome c oxidase subunit III
MTTPAAIPTKSPNAPRVAPYFDDYQQQTDACLLGMWAFLVSEIMFFGGLFATYMVYRHQYPAEFAAASRHLDLWLGTFNTWVLLTSSLTMALAVRTAHLGQPRAAGGLIALTMLLGVIFLGVKFAEYIHKYHEGLAPLLELPFEAGEVAPGPMQLFFGLYFAMTGVHALHMIIGVAALGWLLVQVGRGHFTGAASLPVEVTGLYWHFVDLIWIFLFPLLYLIDRSA